MNYKSIRMGYRGTGSTRTRSVYRIWNESVTALSLAFSSADPSDPSARITTSCHDTPHPPRAYFSLLLDEARRQQKQAVLDAEFCYMVKRGVWSELRDGG